MDRSLSHKIQSTYHRYDADSTSWVPLLGGADITAVTITTAGGSGLSGGSTASSGAFTSTLIVDVNGLSSVTPQTADEMLISDVTDSNTKKRSHLMIFQYPLQHKLHWIT